MAKHLSDQEWMTLISTCRSSGLSDYMWCIKNNIPRSTFYNAVTRLRKKACAIPEQIDHNELDITSCNQDVVKVNVMDDIATDTMVHISSSENIDNLYTMKLQFGSFSLMLSNKADPTLAGELLRQIGGRNAC